MISRTAPCPPGRDETKCTASSTYGSASEGAAENPTARSSGRSTMSSPT